MLLAEPLTTVILCALPCALQVMDDDEQFEHMQMTRVMETEPESLAFVRARKAQELRMGARKKAGAPGRR